MLSVDTNVLVRFLTADHPDQFRRAERLIRDNDIQIATTVLIETEWVLRSVYEYSAAETVGALLQLTRLPRVSLSDERCVAQALEWAADGMDVADAMHLAAAEDCEAFVSFDRPLLRRARRLGQRVREP